MQNKIFKLFFFFLLYSSTIYSYSCRYIGGFAYANQYAPLVVYGTVIAYDSIGIVNKGKMPFSMKFVIKEKLRGKNTNDTITIWGDNGGLDRPYLNKFEIGSEWIFALSITQNKGEAELSISSCGEYYVRVKKGKVIGKIYDWSWKVKDRKYDYETVKNSVLKPWEHPFQRPFKKILTSDAGIKHYTYCDVLPSNSLNHKEIYNILNGKVKVDDLFFKNKDEIILHIPFIVDEMGQIHYDEDPGFAVYLKQLNDLQLQVFEILKNTGRWQVGLEKNKPVAARLVFTVVLKKPI
ncbi:MAG: hypothetical protein ACOVLC_05270 [Flavobacterium sp.]